MESLLKLHRKIKSFDVYLDDRGELSTTRSAWNEVRDNVERGVLILDLVYTRILSLISSILEAQVREAFCSTLTSDVINPLTVLKVCGAVTSVILMV